MMVEGIADFVASYDRYFTVVRADTPALLDLAYRLRYQVYCVENQFEDPTQHRDGRETDEDDNRSVHALLVHRRSGAMAGTVRVIMPVLGDTRRQLPICQVLKPAERLRFHPLLLEGTGEISRFAVSKRFRQRRGEGHYPDAGFPYAAAGSFLGDRRLMPFITFGLLRAVLGICLEHGIIHLAAMMEPALIRILVRLGLVFEALGELVEHHGRRQPCVARLADLIQHSRERAGLLWQYASQEVAGIEAVPRLTATEGRRSLQAWRERA